MVKFIVDSPKDFDSTCTGLNEAVMQNKFGVLHVHDLKETMNKKGVPFEKNARIFEVCNPHKAKQILDAKISYNLGLPCRISVWEEDGIVKVGMVTPSTVLGIIVDEEDMPTLKPIVEEVDGIMMKIIRDATAVP